MENTTNSDFSPKQRFLTDLHKVEALVTALAHKMLCTRDQAAQVIKNLDSQRRRNALARATEDRKSVV